MDLLPEPYAVGLRLAEAGAAPELIAAGLGIELASLPALLALAGAKLDQLAGTDEVGSGR